ncbi:hypothetical protein ACFX11_018844 [Malus domestica]
MAPSHLPESHPAQHTYKSRAFSLQNYGQKGSYRSLSTSHLKMLYVSALRLAQRRASAGGMWYLNCKLCWSS